MMSLIRLATTRASFVCSSCVKTKAGDKLSDVTEEIQRLLEQERANKVKLDQSGGSQAAGIDSAGIEEPPASPAPQLLDSQTETQSIVADDDSWAASGRMRQTELSSSIRSPGGQQSPARSNQRRDGGDQRESQQQSGVLAQRKPLPERKNAICRYYGNGTCKYGQKGEGCKYSHPKKCLKYMRFARDEERGCNSRSCSYYHPPLCRLVESGRTCTRQRCKYFHRQAATKLHKRKRQTRSNHTQRPVPGSYAEAVTAVPSSVFPPTVDSNSGYRGNQARAADESHQTDFRLLQEQMARMEKQLRYLLDVRDRQADTQRCLCR